MEQTRSMIEKSISFILIGIIALFAFTSTGNVTEYVHLYHQGATGITLGITFGVTVFTCAYIAATGKSKETRVTAVVIGSVFGLASAFFQMQIYIKGGAALHIAAMLSFIPILAGEVGLAILEHFYSKDANVQNVQTVQIEHTQNEIAPDTERAIAPIKTQKADVQFAPANESSKSENLSVIEPRGAKESEFWSMLNADVQYEITKLAAKLGVAPNTLRNWRKRWESAQLNSAQFVAHGD